MRLKIANSNTERYNFGVYKRTGDTKMSAYILNLHPCVKQIQSGIKLLAFE